MCKKTELIRTGINLVPKRSPFPIVSYACSWGIQPVMGGTNGMTACDYLNDQVLFSPDGWVNQYDESIRGDLIYLPDWGWDFPPSVNGEDDKGYYGSFIVDPIKFPNYGETLVERMKTFADKVKAAGWHSLGVWVCCQEDKFHETADGSWDKDYWLDRILWSKAAGITYWKNDFGKHAYTHEWREYINYLTEMFYPELIQEVMTGDVGTNDPDGTGTCQPKLQNMLRGARYSDVFRTYDVTVQLSAATTMERVSRILEGVKVVEGPHLGLLNCEDELCMAAALGCAAGIMRFPGIGKNDMDEATRMVAWHRIAPPFDMSAYPNTISETILTDAFHFTPADTWDASAHNKTIYQHTSAAIARGIDLPTARGEEVPFLLASRNPITGAISVCTMRRTSIDNPNHLVYADVALNAGALTGPVGVFGVYKTLTLTFDKDISGLRILAQDLKGTDAFDITDAVTVRGNTLTICGELLKEIGTEAASENDPSEPGLMIRIGDEADWVAPPPALPRHPLP